MLNASARLAIGYTSALVHAAVSVNAMRRPDVRNALARQVQLSGVQALPFVASVAVLFGSVVVSRAFLILGADNEYAMNLLVWGGIWELGPLVPALLIIARSSVAIAAEVGLMGLRAGISDAFWKDAAHEQEIVLPRVFGTSIACAMLVAYFQCAAIAAALVGTAWTLATPIESALERFLSATNWWQIPLAIAKGGLIGAGIGAISCYHGMSIRKEAGEIPKAVASACLGSLVFVMLVDLIGVILWLL
jgi:phospholipid/cholesterol/gamma-HCH transport system permease protein